jgi:hypothetical protein
MKLIVLDGHPDTLTFVNPDHIVAFHNSVHEIYGNICLILLTGGRKLFAKETAEEIETILLDLYDAVPLCLELPEEP